MQGSSVSFFFASETFSVFTLASSACLTGPSSFWSWNRIGPTSPATDYHRLRIRCKRLRYALEFLSDLYPGATRPLMRRLVTVQDVLGVHQDADVAGRPVHARGGARLRLPHAAGVPAQRRQPRDVAVEPDVLQRHRFPRMDRSLRRATFKTSAWFAMSRADAGANVVNAGSSSVSTAIA